MLRRAQAGDERAFDDIVCQFGALVLKLARSITRHRQDAEDVAQEVFLRLFQTIDRVDPERPLEPWLVRLTLNAGRNRVARRPERREDGLADDPMWEPAAAGSPGDELARSELRATLAAAIDGLPGRTREVFLLREVHGFETALIAEALGITEVTVRRLASDGREKVARRLDRAGGANRS